MNISPVKNITKRALPLAASAAIGLGALTSCSSDNKTNNYPTYKEDIEILDNTLESVKQFKNEEKLTFPEYYYSAKDVIEKTEFNQANNTNTPGAKLDKFGKLLTFLGCLGVAGVALKCIVSGKLPDSKKAMFAGMGLICAGVPASIVGFEKDNQYNKQQTEKLEEYKAQKLEELDAEKVQYFETNGLKLTKQELDLLM